MSRDPAFEINHQLRKMGLSSLSDAKTLIPQLAMFVRDDAHFATLLNACDPAERRDMYEALAPNLRFQPRSLAEYLIANAQDAERRQLPTIGPGGELVPFRVPELQAPLSPHDAIATAAVAEAMAKERLWVVCVICTREDVFHGITKEDAVADARKAGWRYAFKNSLIDPSRVPERVEVCPACVKARAPRVVTA